MLYLNLCQKGNIFVIVIVFSSVTILVYENKLFCLEVSWAERKDGISTFSVFYSIGANEPIQRRFV